MGGEEGGLAIEYLCQGLASPNPSLKKCAAEELAGLKSPELVACLVRSLDKPDLANRFGMCSRESTRRRHEPPWDKTESPVMALPRREVMAKKILIIDDEKDMRVYLGTLFRKAGL